MAAPNGILPRSVARITGISLLVGAAFAPSLTVRSAGPISSDHIPSGFQWHVEHLRTSASLQIAPKAEFDFRAIKRRRGSVPAERRNV